MPYPDENNLTELETLKSWIPIPLSDVAADAQLQRLIYAASNFLILEINRRNLFSLTDVEFYNGDGGWRLFPNRYPITAITQLKINDTIIPVSTGVYGSGYKFDKTTIYLYGYRFERGIQNVELASTAGVIAVGSKELRVLEQATLEAINLKWKRRQHADQEAQSLGNQLTTKFITDDFPPEVWTVIRKLKRKVPL